MPILLISYRIITLPEKIPRGPIYSPLTPVLISEGRPNSQRTPIPTSITPIIQRKRITQTPETPLNKRRTLGERDINKQLNFTPILKSGRARSATSKNLKNFRIK